MNKRKLLIYFIIIGVLILFTILNLKDIECIKFSININKLEQKIYEKYEHTFNNNGKSNIFISISNSYEKAIVIKGSGNNLKKAILDGEKNVKNYIKENNSKIKWIKVDIVNSIIDEKISDLAAYIDDDYEAFFYYGISLDEDFENCLLESEINANDVINYSSKTLKLNTINNLLNVNLEELPSMIKLFKTSGYIYDEEVYELYDTDENYDRRILNDELNKSDIKSIIEKGQKYLNNQLLENGKFIYGYEKESLKELTSYNILRHAGTVWSLVNTYKINKDYETKEKIENGINYLIENAVKYKDDNVVYVLEEKNSELKLGANALTILMLTEYMETFENEDYKDIAVKLGNGIIESQNDDGSFVHVLLYPNYRVKDEFRTVYYDGESIYALTKLYSFTKQEKFILAAQKAIDYCIENNYEKHRDHWVSYGLNEFTKLKKDAKYYDFAIRNLSYNINKIVKNKYTSPICLELLLAGFETYERAENEGINLEEKLDKNKLKEAIKYRAEYQLNGYFYPEYAMYFKEPIKILNSFFVRNDDFRVRIDDVQHNLGAYYLLYNNYEKIY